MKRKILVVTGVLIMSFSGNAKSKKVDWSLCEQEIAAHCSKAKDDHDKHECLEKLPKVKVSEECREKNEKLEGAFDEHNHDHK